MANKMHKTVIDRRIPIAPLKKYLLMLNPETGMEVLLDKRNAPVADNHDAERGQGIYCQAAVAPPHGYAQMQIDTIGQPGNQRPDLHRVPVPVAPLDLVGPEGAGNDHQPQHDETAADEAITKIIQGFQIGYFFVNSAGVSLLQEKQQAESRGSQHAAETGRGTDDVYPEPLTLQRCWERSTYIFYQGAGPTQKHKTDRHHQYPDRLQIPGSELDDQEYKYGNQYP